jgi:hypothetical protein
VGEGSIAIQLVPEYFVKAEVGYDDLGSIPDKRGEGNTEADESTEGEILAPQS